MYKILAKTKLNETVDQMIIEAPLISKNTLPGHFVILRVVEGGERIPLTIVDHDLTSITIIYQKLGYTTNLLGTKEVGDSISDVVGPLGMASHIRNVSSILGIAGGVGAAPLFPQLREYKRRGVNVDLILGARSKDYLILVEEYQKICNNVYFSTDDGSFGEKGFVTDVLRKLEPSKHYDHVVAIGPLVMMKNVAKITKDLNISTDVSLNPIMIDGTGMCGNCRVSINGKTFFACVDGPDFDADGIDFDELMSRQDYYKDEEHICNLELKINENT